MQTSRREPSDEAEVAPPPLIAPPPPGTEASVDPLAQRHEEFLAEYSDRDYYRLESRRRSLGREIGSLARPIHIQKLASGDYVELPPLSEGDEGHRISNADYRKPGFLEPLLSTVVGQIEGTDKTYTRVVVVRPEDHPELYALCEEKDWLSLRMRELSREGKGR